MRPGILPRAALPPQGGDSSLTDMACDCSKERERQAGIVLHTSPVQSGHLVPRDSLIGIDQLVFVGGQADEVYPGR